jgi:hypothetical protein
MSKDHNDATNRVKGWNVVDPRSFEDSEPQERVNLDPEAFDRIIKQKGVFVKLYRSTYCPNVKSIDGGEHNIDCDLCNGSGWLDVYPICVKAFIQSQNNEKSMQAQGYVDDNTVMFTFPIGIELQYFTLIELRDFTDIYIQRVARAPGQKDSLKYKALRVNVLVDKNNIEYLEGSDFSIDQNGRIEWKPGKGPAEETIYSVHYEAKVQFRATTAIHVNRFTQVSGDANSEVHIKMPEQWMCTKEFLVRNRDEQGNDIPANPIPDYDEETPE